MSQTKQSEIAAAYDAWAETYDTVANATRDLAGEVLRQVATEPQAPSPGEKVTPGFAKLTLTGRKVVEVGCGTGRNTEWLARSAAREVIGLDFSEAMLARARDRVTDRRVAFVPHDVRAPWPPETAKADLVIAMLVLEHVADLGPFFAEAGRALTAGGDLFICELHPMRQLLGGQAQFTNTETGEKQLVPAFLHNVSDYVNAGLAAGFALTHLGEWRDSDARPQDLPRLLSLTFRLPGPTSSI